MQFIEQFITYVKGSSGWFLDQMKFVTNRNQTLCLGGIGGDAFSTRSKNDKENLDTFKLALVGTDASVVHSDKRNIAARLCFLMYDIGKTKEGILHEVQVVTILEFIPNAPNAKTQCTHCTKSTIYEPESNITSPDIKLGENLDQGMTEVEQNKIHQPQSEFRSSSTIHKPE